MKRKRWISLLLLVVLIATSVMMPADITASVESSSETLVEKEEKQEEGGEQEKEVSEEKITAPLSESLQEEQTTVPKENDSEDKTETDDTKKESEGNNDEKAEAQEKTEEKEDSSANVPQGRSLLPLEEKHVYLHYGNLTGIDISAVPVEIILNNLLDAEGNKVEVDPNAKKVWSYYKDADKNIIMDHYFEIEEGGTLDLSIFQEYERYTWEMIVGDGNQLNPNNIRYIITIYLTDEMHFMNTYELYTQDVDGTRHKVETDDVIVDTATIGEMRFTVRTFVVNDYVEGEEYYLGINYQADEHPLMQCDVLSFSDYLKYMTYEGEGEYEYTSLRNQFINQDMRKKDAGYKNTWNMDINDVNILQNQGFGFLLKSTVTGRILRNEFEVFRVVGDAFGFNDDAYIYEEDVQSSIKEDNFYEIKEYNSKRVDVREVMLKKGYSADSEYYYTLVAHSPFWENANAHVVKAVEGLYNTLEETAEAEDISSQLLPEDLSDIPIGYKANYNIDKGGQFFTVFFDDGTAYYFQIVFSEYNKYFDEDYIKEYSEAPIVGEADPWFRIVGATNATGEQLDSYVIENGKNINMDTSYGYGYQTVFLNQNVDSFIPEFWRANEEDITVDKIYVDGRAYNEGDELSFDKGENTLNATFSVVITDSTGSHTKNYNVTFVKKTEEAQLYVAGPLAPEVRSVFLDEYFENKHDIFIANVGNEPLTDLWLDLDATNVALDEYWTIGGTNNDTLAACPENFSLELDSTEYGELSNVAKIRLVPPEDSNGGGIEGTLKIYSGKEGDADGSELLATIILSGRAQNPRITTEELDDAVKYVPYSYMVTTNNMYDWTDVEFSISGELPAGVEFIEETGEIYGVPQETGTFPVTVTAAFTSDTYEFESSTVELTLTVLDNTNVNVYESTDEEYQILESIGEDASGDYDFVLTEISDQLFVSNGEFDEFQDLWLNGEKLVDGVDYTKEEGSTRITISSQTFANKVNKDGTNTLAAEFRVDSERENELKRTAQNFRLDIRQENPSDENPAEENNGGQENDSSQNGGNAANPQGENNDRNSGTGRFPVTPRLSSMAGNDESEEESSSTVTMYIQLVDMEDQPLENYTIEVRSTPKEADTNEKGIASFRDVEFGTHTLTVKTPEGETAEAKEFKIEEGEMLSLNDDVITAKANTVFTLKVVLDGDNLTLKQVKMNKVDTGDSFDFAIWICMFAAAGTAVAGMALRKSRKKWMESK
ncbi:MAG: putative Ig domain-containing protein [Ruminococcus sp.]|jgi:hypothetical protein